MDKPAVKLCVSIEDVQPCVNGGRYHAKAIAGDRFEVSADVFRHGHKKAAAIVKYRKSGSKQWLSAPMEHVDNDRFAGSFSVDTVGVYEYTVEAFTPDEESLHTEHSPVLRVWVDPEHARFGSWYEMWPRSQGTDPARSATFSDMIKRLHEIKAMGFDVIYLPPIHPIGRTNRKGANNATKAGPKDPGCPFAIGNEAGGHMAIEPGLGDFAGFASFVKEARKRGFRIALDYVLNCSPDHQYAKEHPGWFFREADGTIKFAENPPKKYEDVYPFDLYCEEYESLWEELKKICLFWIGKGVSIFRVDNPHTKPVAFWEWLIAEIHSTHPETLFLSEAFTKPKMMKLLGKAGFTQSYSYFTWRNTKQELTEYVNELTSRPVKDFMRVNFFVNTPDILPFIVQTGGRPAFIMRAVLAATLMPSWGMYNGYELCENRAVPGKEEYLNSEKYQFKVWDWDRPGNIKDIITRINRIRCAYRAFRYCDNIRFHTANNDRILFYSKRWDDELILVAVNLDPHNAQESMVDAPIWMLDMAGDETYRVRDLLTDREYTWKGNWNYVRLDPAEASAHIFLVKRLPRS